MANEKKPSQLEPPADDLIPPSGKTHPLWWRVVLMFSGFGLILLGIVGWLVPIVTGVPFWIAGLILLASSHHVFRRMINWMDRKLPVRVQWMLRHARDRAHNFRARHHIRQRKREEK